MRARSDTWISMVESGNFSMDTVAIIDGYEYSEISAPKITRTLFSSKPTVGNCNSACVEFAVRTDRTIPKAAEVIIKSRLKQGADVTEWMTFGTFYISQRSVDLATGKTTLTCYDAMLKANQQYCVDESEDSTVRIGWPKSMVTVVNEIAERIGVEIDERTSIKSKTVTETSVTTTTEVVSTPVYDDDGEYLYDEEEEVTTETTEEVETEVYAVTFPDELTMMDVLGYIGACHAGNWIITPENKLRLVPLVTALEVDYETAIGTSHPAGGGTLLVSGILSKATTGKSFAITGVSISREGEYTYTADYVIADDDTQLTDTSENIINQGNATYILNSETKYILDCGDSTENAIDTMGEDGYTFDCGDTPYANQTIADELFEQLQGLVYQPFTVSTGVYDPAVELGDWVFLADGTASVLYSETAKHNAGFRGDISAPSETETEDEYPYLTITEKIDLEVGSLRTLINDVQYELTSGITQTYDSIVTYVKGNYVNSATVTEVVNAGMSSYIQENAIATESYVNAQIETSANSITSTVEQYYSSVETLSKTLLDDDGNLQTDLLKNYYTISEVDSAIEQTKTSILQTVSAEYKIISSTLLEAYTQYTKTTTTYTTELPEYNIWSSTMPTAGSGYCIWVRTKFVYGDEDDSDTITTYSDPVCFTDTTLTSITTEYNITDSEETEPDESDSGWSTTPPQKLYQLNSDGTCTYYHLWVRYVLTTSKGTEYSEAFLIEDSASRALVEQLYSATGTLENCIKLLADIADDATYSDLYEYMVANELDLISIINASASVIQLKSNRLTIESDYFTLEEDGTITATAGNIGGWIIGEGYLYSGSGSSYVRLNVSDGESEIVSGDTETEVVYTGDYAIWAGAETPDDAPFSVMKDGTTTISDGVFTGALTGATGSFSGRVDLDSGMCMGDFAIGGYFTVYQNDVLSTDFTGYETYCEDKMSSTDDWTASNTNYTFTATKKQGVACLGTYNKYLAETTQSLEKNISIEKGEYVVRLDVLAKKREGYPIVKLEFCDSTKTIATIELSTVGNTAEAWQTFSKTLTLSSECTTVRVHVTSSPYVWLYLSSLKIEKVYNPSGYIGYLSGATDEQTTDGIGFMDASKGNYFIITNGGCRITYTYADEDESVSRETHFYMIDTNAVLQSSAGATLTINGGGTTDSSKVELVGANSYKGYLTRTTDDLFGLYAIAGSTKYWLVYCNLSAGTKNLYSDASSSYSISDIRRKHDIQPLEADSLEQSYLTLLDNMNPVRFVYNDDEEGQYTMGYVAQDVVGASQCAGLERGEVKFVHTDREGYMWLAYTELIPLLHLKIKQQEARINVLTERIASLEGMASTD